jgi:hypothetical protein
MKEPNYHIEFYKEDFGYSPQVSAEATSVRYFGIDWKRLFDRNTGYIDNIRSNNGTNHLSISGSAYSDQAVGTISTIVPVIGERGKGKVSAYALYKIMQKNPGYDVIIYPQYHIKKFSIPLIYSKQTVKVTARLGRLR